MKSHAACGPSIVVHSYLQHCFAGKLRQESYQNNTNLFLKQQQQVLDLEVVHILPSFCVVGSHLMLVLAHPLLTVCMAVTTIELHTATWATQMQLFQYV